MNAAAAHLWWHDVNSRIVIRKEAAADVEAIAAVTVAAFRKLRAADALKISLVAEAEGRVVGHIAFSPVTISDGAANWYGLGPVSVLPEYQRQGIGSALVLEGLARLKGLGAGGCCLVGYPDYYRRFGFRSIPGLVHPGVPEEVFLALVLDGRAPQGTVEFHEGFKARIA